MAPATVLRSLDDRGLVGCNLVDRNDQVFVLVDDPDEFHGEGSVGVRRRRA